MANISVVVQDANNVQLNLTPAPATTLIAEGGNNVTLELTPTPTQVITLDRGVAGVGIESITVVTIDGDQYLHIVFTNGSSSDVGPISATSYTGVTPIVVNNTTNQISLDTVPVALGGTGATNAADARSNLGLGTITTQNANAVAITGGSISGSTLSGDTVGGANPYLDFADGTAVTLSAGRFWYNATTGSWNLGMGNGNITQQIGEELFIYGKASAAITEGQLICKTGTVGASGVITFGPSPTGLTTNDGIIGVATENIALNGFGRINSFGVIHGINTTGSSVGETWLDNDTLYYNPNYAGGLTKVKPSAPYAKFEVGTVINASSGGSGSIQVDLIHGSTLGGTDSNVQINGVSNGNTLIYDATAGYWKNASITAGAGISVTNGAGSISVANTGVRSISGGTTGLTPSTATTGAVTLAGTLAVANGGTGATTASAALTSLGAYPSSNPSGYTSNTGTVTSVGMTVPTGLSISGTPVTTSGTFALTLTAGYSIPTTSNQTNWDSAYTQRLQWDGGSTNLVAATGRTSLGATTVGGNMFTLTNPSAITFPRFNADNTISALDAATFRTAIGAGTSSTTGTVTSVSGTGTVSGLSLSGTVTTSGNITLGGTLSVTPSNFASQTANYILAAPNGAAGVPTFRALVAADVPTLNQNTTGTASNVTGTVAIANGGTGATTRQDAMDALAGATTSGQYLRGNGTDVVMSAIQAADVPTLNQNTTGTAANVTGTVAIANGGTGSTTAAGALTNLGAYAASNPSGYTNNTGTVTSITAGTGLSGGTITTTGTIALANTTVTAGSYTTANFTVDAQGRITAASNGSGSGATISDDTTTAATYYPLVATATSGTLSAVKVSSTKYTYNPSTGTLTATTVTGSSDERLKSNWKSVCDDFIEKLSKVKHGTYDHIDSNARQVGASAQGIQEFLQEGVDIGADGMLSLNYGGVALVAAIKLSERLLAAESRIEQLEQLLKAK